MSRSMKTGCLLLTVAAVSLAAPALAAAQGSLVHRSGPYDLQILVNGQHSPVYQSSGESYVLGHHGNRYVLRITNRSNRRVEAVISVDGRDVVDGAEADFRKRGYLVPARGHVDIDGWRISRSEVAAFRFSSVPESYAAQTGNAREVGSIGVAIFPERRRPRRTYPAPLVVPEGPHVRDGRRTRQPQGGARPSRPNMTEPHSMPAPDSNDAIARPDRSHRPGLGTQFGEARYSRSHQVRFRRANRNRPRTLLGVRYNDRNGLLAAGIDVDRRYYGYSSQDQHLRRTATPFPREPRFAPPPPGWHP